jgi:hypothetical protein
MSVSRVFSRCIGPSRPFSYALRGLSTTSARPKDLNDRVHPSAQTFRDDQKTKPLNPHLTNTTSTNTDDFPKVGARKAPPEMLRDVDPSFIPTDPVPENVAHMTGGTQTSSAGPAELGVGEMEDVTFKVEPLRREGEDISTIRARLLCSCASLPQFVPGLDLGASR